MLVDHVVHTIHWLSWSFFAYKPSLFVCIVFMLIYYDRLGSTSGLVISLLVGLCVWIVYVFIRNGYGLG